MLVKVTDSIWKFTGRDKSNVYFLDWDKKILIDTGNPLDKDMLDMFLRKAVDFEEIDIVILTHLHYDHSGNFDLFPNAEFFASQQAIDDFHEDPEKSVLDKVVADKLKTIDLKPLPDDFHGLEIIHTPGHTKGSVCLWYGKERILFSGDTLFGSKMHGRVDLPTSVPGQMKSSLMTLVEVPYKILCPGHDY